MAKKTLHGIDMSAPGAVGQLLAFHYATFGDAVMKDDSEDDGEDEDAEDQADENADGQDEDDDSEESEEDTKDLGDKGKRAIDAMKAKLKAAKAGERTAKQEAALLKAAQANAGKSASEQAIEAAKLEATEAATAAGNKRILRSEVKAAAATRLKSPALAVKLLDLDELEVDEDGNVDEDAIAEAITKLLEDHPYLAAQGGATTFDSARGKSKPKSKLTKADLAKMTPEAIAKAYDEGRVQA
jgi:hypothetical protein